MSGESRERNVETLAEFFGGVIVFLAGIAAVVLIVIVCLTLPW